MTKKARRGCGLAASEVRTSCAQATKGGDGAEVRFFARRGTDKRAAPKKTTNKEGLDQAYASANGLYRDAQGTVHVATMRGGFLESDWMENFENYSSGLAAGLWKA